MHMYIKLACSHCNFFFDTCHFPKSVTNGDQHFFASMYSQKQTGCGDVKCRATRGATSFPCSSCAPLNEFRKEQCSTYAAPHVALGLTAQQASSVQGGVFDTQFYTRLDRHYQKYGKYCQRIATIGAARRHLRNAGNAMKQKNAPAAIEEMEKAAIAMDVNGGENAKRAADAIDNAARNMSDSIDEAVRADQVANVAKKVNDSIESLEKGELVEASNKMLEAAKEMEKNATKSNNAAAGKQNADSLKKVANSMKQAAVELANEQREAAKERLDLAKEERAQSNAGEKMDKTQKQSIEMEAETVVNAAIADAVRNGKNAALFANEGTPEVSAQAPLSSAVRNNAAVLNSTDAAVSNKLSMHGTGIHARTHAIYAGARGVEAAQKVPSRHSVSAAARKSVQSAAKHRQSVAEIYGETKGACAAQQRPLMRQGGASKTATGALPKKTSALQNWRYQQPAAQLESLVQQFGEPDWVLDQPGGQAVWLDRGIFSRIVLQDAMIAHGNHFDYLTFAVSGIDIPLQGQDELNRLSESVWYDALTDTLYARCHFPGANVASLIVAIDLAHDDDMTLEEALEAYPELIEQSKDPQRYTEMLEMLEADVRAARAAKNRSKTANTNA